MLYFPYRVAACGVIYVLIMPRLKAGSSVSFVLLCFSVLFLCSFIWTLFDEAQLERKSMYSTCVVVVVVVSHIQRIGCQPEKTTLHGVPIPLVVC